MRRRGPLTSRSPAGRALAAIVLAVALGACHSSASDSASDHGSTTTPVSAPDGATTTTTVAAVGSAMVFATQGDQLDAYAPTPPFATQVVVPSADADENGVDVSGQVCFDPTDTSRFVAVDRTAAADGQVGWGVFELSGLTLGKVKATETARLVPTFQRALDPPTPFGCGFLPDGRLLTTDLGNQTRGAADGQLVEWFPPFDRDTVASCKVDVALAAPEGVFVNGGHVYVAESRGRGVTSFLTTTLPTSAHAGGGCSQRDATHALLAFGVVHSALLPDAAALGLAAPAGIAPAGGGNLYVSSPRSGVIAEVTAAGQLVRRVLAPAAGVTFGARPYPTGSPVELAVAPDGSLYYADAGLVRRGAAILAGVRAGTVRRITFVHGHAQAPQVVDSGLQAPQGVGIWVPPGS